MFNYNYLWNFLQRCKEKRGKDDEKWKYTTETKHNSIVKRKTRKNSRDLACSEHEERYADKRRAIKTI